MNGSSEGKSRKILIVDDDSFLLSFLDLVLKKAGYQVIKAADGKQGLEMVQKERPDIIISDLMMPIMDGAEFCKKIKGDEELRDILFLVLTAKTAKENRIDLLNLGADDFLAKPINKDELLAKLIAFGRLLDLHSELKRKNRILQKLNSRLQKTTDKLHRANEEIRATQDKLIQAEKLASIGQLAAGVAHEINNPMGFIYGNLHVLENYVRDTKALLNRYEMMVEHFSEGKHQACAKDIKDLQKFKEQIDFEFMMGDFEKIIEESLEGAERIQKIVNNLRDFSDLGHSELRLGNINQCVESALNLIWNEIKYKAELVKEFGEVPDTYFYPMQLSQLFVNLLLNSAQAIEKEGKIIIRTGTRDGQIHIEIEDNGIGIPKDVLPKIFDPFFTTKDVGEGTGLGLSVVYSIVKRHGGDIQIESEVGKGTKFMIQLPIQTVQEAEETHSQEVSNIHIQ